MKVIYNGAPHVETIPLPCYHDNNGVLQYDSEIADKLVIEAYGDEVTKYATDKQTLELFYKVSDKLRFRIAEITYESYFTDIQGQEWESEFNEMYGGEDDEPEDYEIYNLTVYHFNHKSLKSNLISRATNKLKAMKSKKYIKEVIERIERGEDDENKKS